MERGPHFEGFDVEIGLIEAVEEYNGLCARLFKLSGQVGNAGERLRELDGHRDINRLADAADQTDQLLFKGNSGLGLVGRQREGVEFDSVRAGLLHLFGKTYPSAAGSAVEARQNWNVH